MKLRSTVMVAIAFATSAGGAFAGPGPINGATVYANQCNRCHEYRSPTEFNGPQWSVIMTHMRVIGGIPADEARAVFEYLRSQHHPPYTPPPRRATKAALSLPDAAQGRTLVQQRGCIGCHVVEGQGGKMGPSLDGVTERRSEAVVRQQLADPKVRNPTSLMPNLGLREAEIDAIWLYLRSLEGSKGS